MKDLICRYCGQPIAAGTAVVTFAYWDWGLPQAKREKFYCHAQCKAAGLKHEAFECQRIDADCNDCKHFARGQIIGTNAIAGQCLKFNKATVAWPNKWRGLDCFEHRRAHEYEA